MKEAIPVINKSMKTTINKPMETLANRTETTKEQGMGYDIIEYIKKTKTNISYLNYVICLRKGRNFQKLLIHNPAVSHK